MSRVFDCDCSVMLVKSRIAAQKIAMRFSTREVYFDWPVFEQEREILCGSAVGLYDAALMIAFAQASYLSQTRRMRALAEGVLREYPIRVQSCRFVGHWENTTFQVTSKDRK